MDESSFFIDVYNFLVIASEGIKDVNGEKDFIMCFWWNSGL